MGIDNDTNTNDSNTNDSNTNDSNTNTNSMRNLFLQKQIFKFNSDTNTNTR